jgi:hypothetical protein
MSISFLANKTFANQTGSSSFELTGMSADSDDGSKKPIPLTVLRKQHVTFWLWAEMSSQDRKSVGSFVPTSPPDDDF